MSGVKPFWVRREKTFTQRREGEEKRTLNTFSMVWKTDLGLGYFDT
jgi:hypothetical protein